MTDPSSARGQVVARCLATSRLARLADGCYLVFAGLVVLLACLPTGVDAVRQTISAYALAPQGDLVRLAFAALAVGSLLAALEFRRSVPGWWGIALSGLTGFWALGGMIDSLVDVSPPGRSTTHGQIHAVVATIAFTAVAATVIVFQTWLLRCVTRQRLFPAVAGAVALVSVTVELWVTLASVDSWAGVAERLFFLGSLLWMAVARRTVTREQSLRLSAPMTGRTPSIAPDADPTDERWSASTSPTPRTGGAR